MNRNQRLFHNEKQRSEIQKLIQTCQSAVVVVIDDDGDLRIAYMNAHPVLRRGMVELLRDAAPHFYMFGENEDEAESDGE